MAHPLIAAAIQLLLPVAVGEVKKKLAKDDNDLSSDPKEIPTTIAAPIAAKLTVKGLAKSKTAWIGLVIAVLGFLEANQQLLTEFIGAENTGFIVTISGALMIILRTVTARLVDKGGEIVAPEQDKE